MNVEKTRNQNVKFRGELVDIIRVLEDKEKLDIEKYIIDKVKKDLEEMYDNLVFNEMASQLAILLCKPDLYKAYKPSDKYTFEEFLDLEFATKVSVAKGVIAGRKHMYDMMKYMFELRFKQYVRIPEYESVLKVIKGE